MWPTCPNSLLYMHVSGEQCGLEIKVLCFPLWVAQTSAGWIFSQQHQSDFLLQVTGQIFWPSSASYLPLQKVTPICIYNGKNQHRHVGGVGVSCDISWCCAFWQRTETFKFTPYTWLLPLLLVFVCTPTCLFKWSPFRIETSWLLYLLQGVEMYLKK